MQNAIKTFNILDLIKKIADDNLFYVLVFLLYIMFYSYVLFRSRKNGNKKIMEYFFPINPRTEISIGWKIFLLMAMLYSFIIMVSSDMILIIKIIFTIATIYIVYYCESVLILYLRRFINILIYYDYRDISVMNILAIVIVILLNYVRLSEISSYIFFLTLVCFSTLLYREFQYILDIMFVNIEIHRITEKYYMVAENRERSIRQMKFELICTHFILVIWNLSLIVYVVFLLGTSFVNKCGPVKGLFDAVYYTIIVFSAGGFCDISPSSIIAKLLTLLISCTGLLFIGCFISIVFDKNDDKLQMIKNNCCRK